MRQMVNYMVQAITLTSVALWITGCGGGGAKPPEPDPDSDIQAIQRVDATVGTDGGSIRLDAIADVTIASGVLAQPTKIQLYTTATRMSETEFIEQGILYDTVLPFSYEVCLRFQHLPTVTEPDKFITIELHIPDNYNPPADYGLEVFAQIDEIVNGDPKIIMSRMRPIESSWDPQTRKLRVLVNQYMFISRNGRHELLLRVACTRGERLLNATGVSRSPTDSVCPSVPLVSPLGTQTPPHEPVDPSALSPSSAYNPNGRRITLPDGTTQDRPHWGVDFPAPKGTPVLAVADGKVVHIGFQGYKPGNAGYGNWIVIEHADGSRTLYAHLQDKPSVDEGANVTQGQVIGSVGTTGLPPGGKPHLHFEMAPDGRLRYDRRKNDGKFGNIDPLPCLQNVETGNYQIVIGDNGPAPDDAFRVVLQNANGRTLLTQETRTVSDDTRFHNVRLSNVRPGKYKLIVTCIDDGRNGGDVGTLGISLQDGARFSDGSTTKSVRLRMNETVEFELIIQHTSPSGRSGREVPTIPMDRSAPEKR
jgi:murein DD-endopeptidase MepM/ murein hydrolase activator NlpD